MTTDHGLELVRQGGRQEQSLGVGDPAPKNVRCGKRSDDRVSAYLSTPATCCIPIPVLVAPFRQPTTPSSKPYTRSPTPPFALDNEIWQEDKRTSTLSNSPPGLEPTPSQPCLRRLVQQTALYNEWRPFYLDYSGLKRILKARAPTRLPLAPGCIHLTHRTGPDLLKSME